MITSGSVVSSRTPRSIGSAGLSDLLERATPYENWATPIDPSLSLLARWATIASLGSGVLWLAFPFLAALAESGLILVGASLVMAGLGVRVAMLTLLSVTIVFYGVVMSHTDGLRQGTPAWHYAAYLLVILGTTQVFVLGLYALLLAVNVVIWIVLAILFVVMMFVALAVLAVAAAARD